MSAQGSSVVNGGTVNQGSSVDGSCSVVCGGTVAQGSHVDVDGPGNPMSAQGGSITVAQGSHVDVGGPGSPMSAQGVSIVDGGTVVQGSSVGRLLSASFPTHVLPQRLCPVLRTVIIFEAAISCRQVVLRGFRVP
jgi:hypothetical protein